ncbi:Plasmodium vivax Vir protein, putative [Plasmodium vivax]|nr:Plasmodium vivax Vir protein, putative [Plasmodium vivax]
MVESLFSEKFSQYFIERELMLPSDNFYRTLDHNNEHLGKYNAECKEFIGSSKYKIKRICTQLLKYLESSDKIKDKENSAYDDCLLLNYWIYGKIVEKYYKESHKVIPAFGELQGVWNDLIRNSSNTLYYDKCKPYFHIVMKDDWRKRKELYGYCVDYDTISSMIPYYPRRCKEIYMYLKKKDELYNEYKGYCSTSESKKCPDFFSKCEKKDPTILLKKLNCYDDMLSLEALSSKKGPATEGTDPDLTADKAGLPLDSQTARDGTNPITSSGNVLLGVVVTSMTSGALYKFTPLGRMLRNGLGLNRNNINLHNNGLFDYASGPFNSYSEGGDEHYIGYQPA